MCAWRRIAQVLSRFEWLRNLSILHDERHEKDRQEPLSGASEGDDLALDRVEGQSAAQVSAVADLQGVMSSFDWYLDRVVHFERSDTLTVDHDIVGATTDLHSDRFMRQLESCRHLQSPFCVCRSAVASCFDHEGVTSANQNEKCHILLPVTRRSRSNSEAIPEALGQLVDSEDGPVLSLTSSLSLAMMRA